MWVGHLKRRFLLGNDNGGLEFGPGFGGRSIVVGSLVNYKDSITGALKCYRRQLGVQ